MSEKEIEEQMETTISESQKAKVVKRKKRKERKDPGLRDKDPGLRDKDPGLSDKDPGLRDKDTIKAWWIPKLETALKTDDVDLTSISLKFTTRHQDLAISQAPIAILENADSKELNKIISSSLESAGNVENIPTFEFLVGGRLLSTTIGAHLTDLGISYEAITEVEYFERFPPPTPKDNLEHDDWVSSVMSSGQWLVTGCYDNTVQLWNVGGMEKGRGKQAHTLTIPAHKAPVKAVAWIDKSSTVKSFVSCSIDQTAIVWDWNSKNNSVECVWECRGHTQSVESLGVEIDGTRFATGSWDNTIKIWDGAPQSEEGAGHEEEPDKKKVKKSKTERLKTPILTFGGHSESVSGITWVDRNYLLSCSWDHSIRLWDIEAEGKVTQISGNVAFFCLSYSPKNRTVLAGCADRQIRLYDHRAQGGSVVKSKFTNHTKWVPSVKWSPHDENLFVSGSYDHRIKVWDRRSCTAPIYNLLGHDEKVLSVDWSDSTHIASGSADCTAQIYST